MRIGTILSSVVENHYIIYLAHNKYRAKFPDIVAKNYNFDVFKRLPNIDDQPLGTYEIDAYKDIDKLNHMKHTDRIGLACYLYLIQQAKNSGHIWTD